jgi:2-polyprenyl-6-methoxyphenol hydroxylase-like FAD-dependent oxidoreductase
LARSRYEVAGLPLPGVAIHRSALHDVLLRHFDGELRLGAEVTSIEPGAQPALTFSKARLDCDLIVGADGIRSRAREQIAPDFKTRYSGATCFRFVVDGRFTDEVFEMWGPGKRVGVVPMGSERTYVFLTLNAPPRAPKPFGTLSEFRALWSEFRDPAPEAFARLSDLQTVLHNDLEDGLAPTFWVPGLVLLGDAAHAVTPNMGQGAGLAVEDACCLAHLLSRARPLDATLAEYEALRRPRARRILEQSFRLGRIAQLESSPGRWLRNLALRMTPDSVNDRALRRIVTDMPGVPLE